MQNADLTDKHAPGGKQVRKRQCSAGMIENQKTAEPSGEAWAAELMSTVRKILAEHPDADQNNVRHTLILLQCSPLEPLARSLTRGGAFIKQK